MRPVSVHRRHDRVFLSRVGRCVVVLGLLTVFLYSCSNPIPGDLAAQVGDEEAPVITVTEPESGDAYGSTVTVRGTATDGDGSVVSVVLSVPVTGHEEKVAVEEDGSFEASFTTTGVRSTVTFAVIATDWNGNTASLSRSLENDPDGPAITIQEPENYSAYSSVVRVSGVITDAPGSTATGEIAGASYVVTGTQLAGDLELGDDGAFSFEFLTRHADGTEVVTGSAVIEVTAGDWNGNESLASVTIVRSQTGDFGSFSASPGNGEVTLRWDPVLHAQSYRIRELNYVHESEPVASPYTWEGLTNGVEYAFQITADVPPDASPDARSTVVEAMPVCSRTFAPWVREVGYKSITVEWADSMDIDRYTVERRLEGGDWVALRRTSASSFTDTAVEHNSRYEYRVRADGLPDHPSEPVSASPGRFRREPLSVVSMQNAQGVAVAGDNVFVAAGTGGLKIVDATNPESAIVRASCATTDAWDVAVAGGYAYVADGASGLRVIDVADPSAPSLVGTRDTGEARRVAVSGSHAYIADGPSGLRIIDVSNPASPALVRTHPFDNANSIAVEGSYAYLTTGSFGYPVHFHVIDVATPTSSTVTGTCGSGWGMDIAYQEPYAYEASLYDPGIRVVDVNNPTNPSVVRTVATDEPYNIAVQGSYAYVADGSGGLRVIDVSTPAAATLIDTFYVLDARGVATDAEHVYVADDVSLVGLAIFDRATPARPAIESTYTTSAAAHDVAMVGDTVYVAADDSGFLIVDISNPAAPSLVGSCETDEALAVAVAGSYAYVADGQGGLRVIEISEPASPGVVATVPMSGAMDVVVAGAYLYVADGSDGMRVIDISRPEEPVVVGSVHGWLSRRLTIAGDYVYVADDAAGLRVVNVTDPAAPFIEATHATGGLAYGVAVHGSYAYVTDAVTGLVVVDVSSPGSPQTVTTLGIDSPQDVTIAGTFAFVAAQDTGFRVVDISDPESPDLLRSMGTTFASGLDVQGRYACVADGAGGLRVVRLWRDW